MDLTIDLTTAAGISVATIAVVHYLKGKLADVRFLSAVWVPAYVIAVAGVLTWISHSVLHWVEGDLLQVLATVVIQALAASGALGWTKSVGTSLGESGTAVQARVTKDFDRLTAILLAVALAASLSACGPKLPPNTSPEAQIAVRGTQVMAGLRATLPGIKALVCPPGAPGPTCLRPADADRVVVQIERAAGYAEDLAKVLKAVDEAKTAAERQAGLGKVGAILTSIQGSLSAAQIAPEGEAARMAIVGLLGTVTEILFTVGGV